MSARSRGRRREVDRLVARLPQWAAATPGVRAVAVVGSYARQAARPGSDLDLVVLSGSCTAGGGASSPS